ncbi:Tyrosine--tRNA ligase [Gossypium arboreum]|uniref:Tyrosine--tRNA ligase n=1 Tax=Gossypium arboreum TaxID=29729 RepID=A0A0B0MEJ8_GOSAR|nr:Tyrosine--tRNA ligase [Gossypium arboreum]
MQPPNHHRMVADDAQAKADFANGGELRLCPRRYSGHGLDVVRGDVCGERWWRMWVVRGGGSGAGQRESLNIRVCYS